MRKKIIAGNWKMNIKPSETAALVKGVVEATKDFTNVEVVCCTPAIDVPAAVALPLEGVRRLHRRDLDRDASRRGC